MNTQTKARTMSEIASEAPLAQLPAVADGNSPRIVVASPDSRQRVYPAKIAKSLLAVTRAVGAITKEGENKFHKYFYQRWEDVLDRLSPLLADNGLIIVQSETTRGLFDNDRLISITYEFTIINEDGDVWPERPVKTAIARLVDSKGVADDKAANKCHTQAHKYFLLQLFKIKTREAAADDSDGDTPPSAVARPRAPNPNAPAPTPASPNAPRRIETNRSTTFAGWADEYVAAIGRATTPEQIKEWEQLNDDLLGMLEEKAPAIFGTLVDKVSAHMAKLVQGGKPIGPKPPNPNASAGPPPEFANWRAETEKALTNCKNDAELGDIRDKRITPAKGKVSTEDWQAVALTFKQTVDRIVMQN
jgi:ERF superfamily